MVKIYVRHRSTLWCELVQHSYASYCEAGSSHERNSESKMTRIHVRELFVITGSFIETELSCRYSTAIPYVIHGQNLINWYFIALIF